GDRPARALLPGAGPAARGGRAGEFRPGDRAHVRGARRHRTLTMIIYKSPDEIAKMREAGRIVAGTIERVVAAVAPGRTTADLDRVGEEYIRERGATPSFLGYRGFPASICASVNDEVVHGIPSPKRQLAEGDVM